jgi:hypothetical protein
MDEGSLWLMGGREEMLHPILAGIEILQVVCWSELRPAMKSMKLMLSS